MNKRALRVQEVAELLGLSERTVYSLIRRGELRAIRLGRTWLVPAKALEALLEGTPQEEERAEVAGRS